MSNVALHMFPNEVTRSVFAGIRHLLRPNGLFLFHVNSLQDRDLRARRIQVVREIEDDYVLEESGQVVRFFSEAYLRGLLTGWSDVHLDRLEATTAGPANQSASGEASLGVEPDVGSARLADH